LLDELTSQKFSEDREQPASPMFRELTARELNEHQDQRLAMMIFPSDALKAEYDRPLAVSGGWGTGKP